MRPTSHLLRWSWSLFVLLVSFCSSLHAGEMALPSLPNLPAGEKTYDTGGVPPDQAQQEQELNSASSPAEAQGEPKADTEAVRANKYKIDYAPKTQIIRNGINDKSKGDKRGDLDSGEQKPEQPPAAKSSRQRKLKYDSQPPELGRIGFDSVDKTKRSELP